MHKYLLIILCVALCSFAPDRSATDNLVMKAAEAQLPIFLERLNEGNQAVYGFTSGDDLDRCTVGIPYRMMAFNSDFYLATKLDDEKNYFSIKNEWRVPVSLKDTNRSLLTVSGNPGNYIVTGMGTPVLARELQQKTAGTEENSSFFLLQVPELLADFLVTEHNNSFVDAHFIPLESAVAAIPSLAKKKDYSLLEMQQIVKQALAAMPRTKPQAPGAKSQGKK